MNIVKICKYCHKKFNALSWEVKRGKHIYCSAKCRATALYPSNKKFIEKNRQLINNQFGNNNPSWKGENVGYKGFHWRLSTYRGKPKICNLCGTTKSKRYEWANKSKKYYYDLKDYIRLCKSCHSKFDWDEKYRQREGGKFISRV